MIQGRIGQPIQCPITMMRTVRESFQEIDDRLGLVEHLMHDSWGLAVAKNDADLDRILIVFECPIPFADLVFIDAHVLVLPVMVLSPS